MALLTKVTRKVYFFRLADYADFSNKIDKAIAQIDQLPFDDQGRYQATSGEDTVLALFVRQSTYPIMIQFARIRRDNLPLIEQAGSITPLTLAADAGLMDWSHIVLFEDGIVAAEFVQDAPRIRRLGQYLMFKSRDVLPSAPRFLPLFQRNVMEELENFQNVTILELEAATSDASAIAEGDKDIGAAFAACRDAGKVKRAQLTLKSAGSNDNRLKQVTRSLFNNPSSRESLSKLKLYGKSDGDRKPLDMLEEYLISSEAFVKMDPRFKAVDQDDAFRVLQRAYEANKHKFAGAASANDLW